MYPSKFPLLPILQSIGIILVLLGMVYAAVTLAQPVLLALVVFGLNALPSVPIIPDGDEPDQGDYEGTGSAGFVKNE